MLCKLPYYLKYNKPMWAGSTGKRGRSWSGLCARRRCWGWHGAGAVRPAQALGFGPDGSMEVLPIAPVPWNALGSVGVPTCSWWASGRLEQLAGFFPSHHAKKWVETSVCACGCTWRVGRPSRLGGGVLQRRWPQIRRGSSEPGLLPCPRWVRGRGRPQPRWGRARLRVALVFPGAFHLLSAVTVRHGTLASFMLRLPPRVLASATACGREMKS